MRTTADLHSATFEKSVNHHTSVSLIEKYTLWCENLESIRLLLVAVFLLVQTCLVVPATLLISSFVNIGLAELSLITAVAGTVGVLVTNIGEVSIKWIVGTFVLSLLLNLSLILVHVISIL